MSLSVALNNARSSLLTTTTQISISGRNIAGADDPNYTRKIGMSTTGPEGSVHVREVTRAQDLALVSRVLESQSAASGNQALLDGLERLHESVGDTADGQSPSAKISVLSNALIAHGNAPDDQQLAQAVVTAAQDVVGSLSGASQLVTSIRNDADAAMSDSVDRITSLLDRFGTLNARIVNQTSSGVSDITDALDQRDAIVSQLSDELGLTVIHRENNDVALYTDSGVPLFDRVARSVSFEPTPALAPGAVGGAVMIDGVPVTGEDATMPLKTGRLAGLAELRDTVTVSYQSQLDEIARGLVESFAESDQSGGGGDDLAGLFTWSGAPDLPPGGTVLPGLASDISVNSAVDPSKGGSLSLVRDGGINGVDYAYNATGAASFADRINALADSLGTQRTFDAVAGLQSSTSLVDYSTGSVDWLEGRRQTATAGVEYQNTLVDRATTALSNAVGVNLDDEYARQLQLEQTYAASARLIGVIDELFNTLMQNLG